MRFFVPMLIIITISLYGCENEKMKESKVKMREISGIYSLREIKDTMQIFNPEKVSVLYALSEAGDMSERHFTSPNIFLNIDCKRMLYLENFGSWEYRDSVIFITIPHSSMSGEYSIKSHFRKENGVYIIRKDSIVYYLDKLSGDEIIGIQECTKSAPHVIYNTY